MIADLNKIYIVDVQLDGGIDPLSVFEQWRSKYATILGTESPTQKRTTMPFVDLDKIKWSEAQINIEANTALPSELQLQQLKSSPKRVLKMLQLTEVDFGNEFDFNFTLYNQMGSNLKASQKLEKFVIEGC